MPSYLGLLKDTMMFAANSSPTRLALSDSKSVLAPIPSPVPSSSDRAACEKTPCWGWTHDAGTPHQFTDLGCRVRGMGMNYQMSMPVCKDITFENLFIETIEGKRLQLPVANDFLIDKFFADSGSIPKAARDSGNCAPRSMRVCCSSLPTM